MATINISSYTAYFRSLAVAHALLQHNPASETGDAPISAMHFARWGVDEVITNLRSKVSWPAMLLEAYNRDISSENPSAIRGDYAGAFTILATAKATNAQSVEQAYDLSEGIMNDVLAQIYQDHYGPNKTRCNSPFHAFHFDKMQIIPVGMLFDAQWGWRCEFSFMAKETSNIQKAPAIGTFLNYP